MTHRLLVLVFVLTCTLSPNAQQEHQFPQDGNGLLEYCGQVVNMLDNHSFHADDLKFGWCTGYIQGTIELLRTMQIMMGVQFSERMTKGPLGTFILDGATVGQTARVIVKWLRDHPKDLHNDRGDLTMASLHDAFPCQAAEPPK